MELNNLLSNLFSNFADKPRPSNCEHCKNKKPDNTQKNIFYPDSYLDGKKIIIQSEPQKDTTPSEYQKENSPASNNNLLGGLNMNMIQTLLPLFLNGGKGLDPSALLSSLGGGGQNANILSTLAQAFTGKKNDPDPKPKTTINPEKFTAVNDYIFE